MRRVLRPLFVTGLVSFLLGIWFSLNRAEKNLLQKVQNPKSITLLTDEPELWEALSELSESEGPVSLRLTTAPRSNWQEILHHKAGPRACDLVAFKSFYLVDFIQDQLIQPFSSQDLWWRSELHPDFQSLSSDPERNHFLPLLWTVTQWTNMENAAKPDWRWLVRTSSDEALLLAFDLNLAESIDGDSEGLEWSVVAFRIWQNLKNQVLLAFGASDTFVPTAPVRATQFSSPEALGPGTLTLMNKKNGGAAPTENFDLWLIGLGLCPGQDTTSSARTEFIKWLLQPEVQTKLAEKAQMGSTLMAMSHFARDKMVSPSGLRDFSLNKLRQRSLPWPLGAVWPDVISGKISAEEIEQLNKYEDSGSE